MFGGFDRLVSQLSAAGITLSVAKTRIPIDDIDEWIHEPSAFHQDAIGRGHFLSNAELTGLQQGLMALATNNPVVSQLIMKMMLGQTYKEAFGVECRSSRSDAGGRTAVGIER